MCFFFYQNYEFQIAIVLLCRNTLHNDIIFRQLAVAIMPIKSSSMWRAASGHERSGLSATSYHLKVFIRFVFSLFIQLVLPYIRRVSLGGGSLRLVLFSFVMSCG